MGKIIRTTLLGGVLFLLPLVFVVVVVGKAYQIIKVVATPLGKIFTTDSIAGIALVDVMTVIIMLLCCLIAGLFARSPLGRNLHSKLDAILLNVFPGYAWLKGVIGNIQDTDAEKVLKPVLVRFDDFYQLAFESDRFKEGLVAIYMPDAPDPRSGTVGYVTADRIQPIDAGFLDVVKSCKHIGRGSLEMLAHVEGEL